MMFRVFLHRYVFLVVASLLAIFVAPYFNARIIPYHDTLLTFNIFYFFYNHLFYEGALAQWMPHYAYGLPASYWQIFALTPASYVSMFLGYVFRITDVLWLFKLSLALEHLFFLLGTFCLARILFKRLSTILMVCLGAVCMHSVWGQIFFELRIFYLFPLAAYFLVRFWMGKNPLWFWLTGAAIVLWTVGNTLYFPFLWVFAFFFICLIFVLHKNDAWKSLLVLTPNNVIPCLAVAGLGLVFFYSFAGISHFANMPYRGTSSYNSLGIFLTYGDTSTFPKLLEWLVLGNNWSIYLGALPLGFLLWSLINNRSVVNQAFWASTIAILWLSFGGFFAVAAYFFPGMSFYRHIGLMFGLLKPLILICAGFGWEHFWSQRSRSKYWYLVLMPFLFIFLFDSQGLSAAYLKGITQAHPSLNTLLAEFGFTTPGFRMMMYSLSAMVIGVLAYSKKWANASAVGIAILLLASVIDVCSFQYRSVEKSVFFEHPADAPYLYTVKTHRMAYQEQRTDLPSQGWEKDAWGMQYSAKSDQGIKYAAAYSFTQFEPCVTDLRQDFVPKNTEAFAMLNVLNPQNLKIISGCTQPKLRLVPNALLSSEPKQLEFMALKADVLNTVVLKTPEKEKEGSNQNLLNTGPPGEASVTHYSADHLEIKANVLSTGAWLVYADSYHPGWRARVDGKPIPIYLANLAFKSIYLPAGEHLVRFSFHNGLHTVCSYLIALFALLAGLGLLGLSVFLCWDSRKISKWL